MPAVDSSIVFLPRFSTLIGGPTGPATFTTLPLDVSQFGGAQFQVWRSDVRVTSETPEPTFVVYLEESLDSEHWSISTLVPRPVQIPKNSPVLFSYSFRLRWFRLRIEIDGTNPIVTCWAEGLLRGGGAGVFGEAARPAPAGGQAIDLGSLVRPPAPDPFGGGRAAGPLDNRVAKDFSGIDNYRTAK